MTRKLIPVTGEGPAPSLTSEVDLAHPTPLRALFPILLDGDQLVTSPEHLGVGYLVSVLRRAGADCKVMEVPAGGDHGTLLDEMAAWEPDLVGLTMTTISSAHAKAFGHEVRDRLGPEPFVVAGGPLATFRGAEMLSLAGWEFLDALVRGEGEVPILRLAEALRAGTGFDRVPNFSYRDATGAVTTNPMTEAIHDLDQVPAPARDQFELHGARLSARFSFLRLSTSRGCTSFCTFCNAPHARNRVAPNPIWRGCSPTTVVDEIEALTSSYGCRSFAFVDSTFEDPGGTSKAKWRLSLIAQEMLDRKLDVFFGCCMQARNWTEADRPVLDLLTRAGLEYVLVGIESGTDDDLRLWKKRSDVADNERVVRLLREHHVYVQFGFISFHPYTTFTTLRENYDFLYRAGVGHNLGKFLARLELYAGAEVVETLRADGLLLPTYDEDCDEFGYSFRDDRIAGLSAALNRLYGPAWDQHYADAQGPWKFEADDNAVQIFFSRLARAYRDDPGAMEILLGGMAAVDATRQRLAEHNFALVNDFVDRAEHEVLGPQAGLDASADFVAFVTTRAKELRAIQVRTALGLRRAGVSLAPAGLGAAA